MKVQATTMPQEWRSGGTVVIAAFLGYSFMSVVSGSLSMFLEPIGEEFRWSRTLVAGGFSVATIFMALLSPFVGMAIDRYGPRRIAIPGIAATSCAIAAFALASGSSAQWYALWIAYAMISIFVKATIWNAAIASVFVKAQGLALGIAMCGSAASQTILPPLTNWLIDEYGWRMAYVWLGFGWGGLTLLVAWFFLYDAHDKKTVTAARKDGGNAVRVRPDLPGLTIAQAIRDPALWRISISTLIVMALSAGLTIHQIPILNGAGVSRGNAAWLAGMAGIAALAGKVVTGALLDRYRPNWVGGLTLVATAGAFGLLIDGVHTPVLIFIAMLINGYTQGTKMQIVSYLTIRYAGLQNYGTIFGTMNSAFAVGAGAGPVLGAMVFDSAGDYGPFLIAGVIGSIVSGAMLFTLPRYPDFSGEPGTTHRAGV